MLKVIAGFLLGAVIVTGSIATHAFAGNVPPSSRITPIQNGLHQQVDFNVSIGVGPRYDRRRHGPRCNFRRNGCNNYYQGYYYQNPWWLVPGIVVGNDISNDRRDRNHSQWCSDRYRSYSMRDNTWMSNGGQRRQCNSP